MVQKHPTFFSFLVMTCHQIFKRAIIARKFDVQYSRVDFSLQLTIFHFQFSIKKSVDNFAPKQLYTSIISITLKTFFKFALDITFNLAFIS